MEHLCTAAMVIDHSQELTNRIRELCTKIDAAVGNDDEITSLTTELRAAVKEYLDGVRLLAKRSYPMETLPTRRIKPENP